MSDVSAWSQVADDNREAPPDGMPEGWPWRRVTGAFREVMAAAARWYQAAEWLRLFLQPVSKSGDREVRIDGANHTALFAAGQRVRLAAGATTVDCQVVSATYSVGDTWVEVDADVPIGCDSLLFHIASQFREAAFHEVGLADGQIPASQYVRGLSTGEVPFQLQLPTDVHLVDTTILGVPFGPGGVAMVPIDDADGTQEFWATYDLNFLADVRSALVCTVVLQVFCGPNASPFFPAEKVLEVWVRVNDSPDVPSGFSSVWDRHVSIPNVYLGTPAAGDKVALWAYIAPGNLSTTWIRGTAGAPLHPSHLTLKRHFG